jgi:hypothetical protein
MDRIYRIRISDFKSQIFNPGFIILPILVNYSCPCKKTGGDKPRPYNLPLWLED